MRTRLLLVPLLTILNPIVFESSFKTIIHQINLLVERGFLHSFLDALLVRLAVLLPSSSALICFVWNCATTRILQRRLHIARITRNTIVHGNAVVGCFIIIIMLFPANNLPPAHPAALSLRNGEYFVNAPRDIFPRSSRPALAQ